MFEELPDSLQSDDKTPESIETDLECLNSIKVYTVPDETQLALLKRMSEADYTSLVKILFNENEDEPSGAEEYKHEPVGDGAPRERILTECKQVSKLTVWIYYARTFGHTTLADNLLTEAIDLKGKVTAPGLIDDLNFEQQQFLREVLVYEASCYTFYFQPRIFNYAFGVGYDSYIIQLLVNKEISINVDHYSVPILDMIAKNCDMSTFIRVCMEADFSEPVVKWVFIQAVIERHVSEENKSAYRDALATARSGRADDLPKTIYTGSCFMSDTTDVTVLNIVKLYLGLKENTVNLDEDVEMKALFNHLFETAPEFFCSLFIQSRLPGCNGHLIKDLFKRKDFQFNSREYLVYFIIKNSTQKMFDVNSDELFDFIFVNTPEIFAELPDKKREQFAEVVNDLSVLKKASYFLEPTSDKSTFLLMTSRVLTNNKKGFTEMLKEEFENPKGVFELFELFYNRLLHFFPDDYSLALLQQAKSEIYGASKDPVNPMVSAGAVSSSGMVGENSSGYFVSSTATVARVDESATAGAGAGGPKPGSKV